MVEMKINGMTTHPLTHQQVVWLKTLQGDTVLPIVIGGTEAISIYASLAHEQLPRPMTHDLLKTVLEHTSGRVEEVRIINLKEGTFYSEIVVAFEKDRLTLDARPSDGIALALRFNAPVYLDEEVLSQAGLSIAQIAAEAQARSDELPQQEALSEEALSEAIENLLKETGLDAPSIPDAADPASGLKALKARLKEAVKTERYEEAARIQAKIEQIEQAGGAN